MYLLVKNQKGLLTLLILFIYISGVAQVLAEPDNKVSEQQSRTRKDVKVKKNHIGLELGIAVQQRPNITRSEGNYELQSFHMPAYEGGINYFYNINNHWLISTGFHGVVGELNYFSRIPDSDVAFSRANLRYLMSFKDIWFAIKIPLLVEKKINAPHVGLVSAKAGLNIQYSGFTSDLSSGVTIRDSVNNEFNIFYATFSNRNNYLPWVTFSAGVSKLFVLDNKNILSIGLLANLSNTHFFKGNYMITIPGQPITSGTYSINGTSLGLTVQYIFTGSNKQLLRRYQEVFR